jgi:glycolate oxidase iron-sulfur subunit
MPDRKLIDECVHCGFCLPACPTYQSWGQEMDSPRGRIYLMKAHAEGRMPMTATLVQHFDRCLGCLGCVTACPSGVKYDQLIEQTRFEVEREYRRPLSERLLRGFIFALFPHPGRLRLLCLLQLVYQGTGLRWFLRRSGFFRLLPRRLAALESLAPDVSLKQVFARLPRSTRAVGERRRRVALLPGCVQGVYFPEVNQASVRVLAADGCDVVVPDGIGCCGALSLHAGREAEARAYAERAIQHFEVADVDTIAVNAAGCGSAMKHWPRLFPAGDPWHSRAQAVAAKVKDVSELLHELGPVAVRKPLPLKVAYHDACHLSHAQGIRAQPRAVLLSIPGLELVNLPDADQCCGSAGVYNLLEPASAQQIGRRKAESIQAVAPELLVSANPGCTLQIKSQLGNAGAAIRTAHPIQVVDAAIRGTSL